MTIIILITIVVLVFIILGLVVYNVNIHKKIAKFSKINEKITGLNVLQSFMETIGEYSSVDKKINRINEIILEKYGAIKYSTIVVFDGAEYSIKTTNVDEKHWDTLKNLYTEEIFQDSISTATPKYITVDKESEKLPYQKLELGRAKSAMFFPLYIDNVYIGYWLIESGAIHAFDNVDTAILEVVRDNIVTILKTVEYQDTMENIVRNDLYSNLKSAEYLYGQGKQIIDKYTISTVAMFKIINLVDINEKINRHLGNKVITEVSNIIANSISQEYIFVRYMRPKFVIVFSGINPEDVTNFIEDIKTQIESTEIFLEESDKKKMRLKKDVSVTPRLNFVLTSYYKGTAIDGVTKKLEYYLDNADKDENDINYI